MRSFARSLLLSFFCICHCDTISKDELLLHYMYRGPAVVTVWEKDSPVAPTRKDNCQDTIMNMLRRDQLPATDRERNCAETEEMLELLLSGRLEKQLSRVFFEEVDIRKLPAGSFYSLETSEHQSNISLNYQAIKNYTLYEGRKNDPDVFELAVMKNGEMLQVCQCTRMPYQTMFSCRTDCPRRSRDVKKDDPNNRLFSSFSHSSHLVVLTAPLFIVICLFSIGMIAGVCRRAATCWRNKSSSSNHDVTKTEEQHSLGATTTTTLAQGDETQETRRTASCLSKNRYSSNRGETIQTEEVLPLRPITTGPESSDATRKRDELIPLGARTTLIQSSDETLVNTQTASCLSKHSSSSSCDEIRKMDELVPVATRTTPLQSSHGSQEQNSLLALGENDQYFAADLLPDHSQANNLPVCLESELRGGLYLLGNGDCADVFHTKYAGERAVYKLYRQRDKYERNMELKVFASNFLRESKWIVTALAVVKVKETDPFGCGIVFEQMAGNLLCKVVLANLDDDYGANWMILWSWQIASGVEFLHNHQLIHGNINSSNILITNDLAICKIGGFGSVTNASDEATSKRTGECRIPLTTTSDTEDISFAYDVFSLAITFWEIVHRRRCNEVRPAIDPNFNIACLGSLITRCCDQKPAERPVICEVVEELWKRKQEFSSQREGMQLRRQTAVKMT